ncbi:hypothetical protein IWX48DRAFT_367542 [Phyllosticta citricarpa]
MARSLLALQPFASIASVVPDVVTKHVARLDLHTLHAFEVTPCLASRVLHHSNLGKLRFLRLHGLWLGVRRAPCPYDARDISPWLLTLRVDLRFQVVKHLLVSLLPLQLPCRALLRSSLHPQHDHCAEFVPPLRNSRFDGLRNGGSKCDYDPAKL